MGCSESKNSIAAGNTVTQKKKLAAADCPKKVEKEEDVVVQQWKAKAEENKGPEGTAGVDAKEGTQEATMVPEVEKKDDVEEKPQKLDENVKEEKVTEPEKENGENEPAKIEEGSTKEAEPVPGVEAPPAVAETADAILTSGATPPEKKGE